MGAGGSKQELTPTIIESLLREYHSFGGVSEKTHVAGCKCNVHHLARIVTSSPY